MVNIHVMLQWCDRVARFIDSPFEHTYFSTMEKQRSIHLGTHCASGKMKAFYDLRMLMLHLVAALST